MGEASGAWEGGCGGSGSGGGRLVVWVSGVSKGGVGRRSVGELRKGEVVSNVPWPPSQTCKNYLPPNVQK